MLGIKLKMEKVRYIALELFSVSSVLANFVVRIEFLQFFGRAD